MTSVDTAAILRILGARKKRRLILSSICLVLIMFFYIFMAGSVLHPKIYTFLHRVTYENTFSAHIVTSNIDSLILLSTTIAWCYITMQNSYGKLAAIAFFSIFLVLLLLNFISAATVGALLTLPFVVALLICDRLKDSRILNYTLKLSLTYLALTFGGLAVLGIINLLIFFPNGVSNDTNDEYTYTLFQELLGKLTPLIMAVLIFCIPFKIILTQLLSHLNFKQESITVKITELHLSSKRLLILLSIGSILGIAIALIPHLTIVNQNNGHLGVDTSRYVEWITEMKQKNTNPIYFAITSPGDRPLTLIVLFLMTEAARSDPFQVVEYSPILLTPLLVLITFYLTKQITANDKISIIAGFLSAISFQSLIGIYSGFYANWLALILGYLCFSLLVKILKKFSKFNLMALVLVLSGTLLAHVYTWTIVISVAFVFLFVLHILHYYPRKHFLVLYLVLSSTIALDILKSSLTGSPPGVQADTSIVISHGFGVSQFNERLGTLAETVQTYYGGVYANIVILGLVIFWLIRCKMRDLSSIFVMIFLSSALVPLFIGDWILQSRVLYNIPFQIPAGISLYTLWKNNQKIIFIAVLLTASYLSLYVLANLGFVPPKNPLSIIYSD